MAKSRAQQAAIAISMKKAGKIPQGYHRMPDGSIMRDSDHKMKKGGSTPAWQRSEGKNPEGGLNAKVWLVIEQLIQEVNFRQL